MRRLETLLVVACAVITISTLAYYIPRCHEMTRELRSMKDELNLARNEKAAARIFQPLSELTFISTGQLPFYVARDLSQALVSFGARRKRDRDVPADITYYLPDPKNDKVITILYRGNQYPLDLSDYVDHGDKQEIIRTFIAISSDHLALRASQPTRLFPN